MLVIEVWFSTTTGFSKKTVVINVERNEKQRQNNKSQRLVISKIYTKSQKTEQLVKRVAELRVKSKARRRSRVC